MPPLCWPQPLSVEVDALSPAALSQHGAPIRAGGVPARVGWSCGTPKLEGQAGGWGLCLSWCSLTSVVLICGDLEKGKLTCSGITG